MTIILLTLAACAPVASDPYTQRAAAEGAIQATSAARQWAIESTRGALDAAALESTRYAGELAAVEAQIQGTEQAISAEQTSVAVQATRSASDLQATAARATSQIIEMQSTQAWLNAYSQAMATATMGVIDRQLAATERAAVAKRARSWRTLGLVLAWGLVIGLLAFLGAAIYGFVILSRAKAYTRRAEAAYMFNRTEQQPPQLPEYTQLQAGETGIDEVIQFLSVSARLMGRDSSRLPRYSSIGWSAERWTRVTNRLGAAGAVTKVDGKGSFVRPPWKTIAGVHRALMDGTLRLPPAPPGDMSRISSPNVRPNGEQSRVGEYWQ